MSDKFIHIKGVIETLLFVSDKPVTLDQMKKVVEPATGADVKNVIKALQSEYEERERGMVISEIAGGYQMLSNPKHASYVRDFYKTKHKERLSKPALEAIAIIAYKQPVTRADIEMIRGVNSDGVVASLLNKELLKVVGRKDVPGRPFLYGTTKQFLEYFGLKSLDVLPKLEEFPSLTGAAAEAMSKMIPEDQILALEESDLKDAETETGQTETAEVESAEDTTAVEAEQGEETIQETDGAEEGAVVFENGDVSQLEDSSVEIVDDVIESVEGEQEAVIVQQEGGTPEEHAPVEQVVQVKDKPVVSTVTETAEKFLQEEEQKDTTDDAHGTQKKD